MAQTIQNILEQMVPELEEYEQREYFSAQEIRQIVKRREQFEYDLKRKKPEYEYYLRYIEYEGKLDQLRKLRKRQKNIKGQSVIADFSILRRIHFIFDRAVRKFQHDVDVWEDWLSFCNKTKSFRKASKVITRALQFHSTNPAIWIYAARQELAFNNNPQQARQLLAMGLKFCKTSVELWLEYFCMELQYAKIIFLRQQVLLDEEDKTSITKAIDHAQSRYENGRQVDQVQPYTEVQKIQKDSEQLVKQQQSEQKDQGKNKKVDVKESEKALSDIISGNLAYIVFKSAKQKIGSDIDVQLRFLEACSQFPIQVSLQLFQRIVVDLFQEHHMDSSALTRLQIKIVKQSILYSTILLQHEISIEAPLAECVTSPEALDAGIDLSKAYNTNHLLSPQIQVQQFFNIIRHQTCKDSKLVLDAFGQLMGCCKYFQSFQTSKSFIEEVINLISSHVNAQLQGGANEDKEYLSAFQHIIPQLERLKGCDKELSNQAKLQFWQVL